ncbi:MAG: MFS transporter [archaeon]
MSLRQPDRRRFDVRRRLTGLSVYYGWIIVGACFLIGMITWGTIWSFGVFFGYIIEEFGLSRANTSIIFSIQSIVSYTGAALLGFWIDRYGARRLLLVSTVLVVGGLFGVSTLPSFLGVTVSYGIVTALGLGIAYVVSYVAPVRWFDRRRGLATGIATAGAGAGIVLVPPIAEWSIDLVGWRSAYTGLTLGFFLIYAFATIVFADRPRDLDLDASAEFESDVGGVDPGFEGWRSKIGTLTEVVRSREFVLVFLAYICLSAAAMTLLVNVVEYTTIAEIGRSTGVAAISVLGAMNVVGKFVGGPAVDRIGTTRTIAGSGVFLAGGLSIMVLANTSVAVVVAAVVFGFGWGIWSGFLAPLLADLFGTVDINALFGLVAVAFAFSGSLAPYLAGLSVDRVGTYEPAFVGAGLIALLGTVSVLTLGRSTS